MTTPGAPSGGGQLIARGYIQIDLEDNTRAELEALLARLRAEGGVVLPIRFDQAQLQAELARVQPVTMPVTFDHAQLQAELARVPPVALPVTVDTSRLQTSMSALRPFTLPVTLNRDHLQEHLDGMHPLLLPVRVAPSMLAAQLAAAATSLVPVDVPVQADPQQIVDSLSGMPDVRVPVKFDRAQLQRALNSVNPLSLPVRLSRDELAAQTRFWQPIGIPVKLTRAQLQRAVNGMNPVSLPVVLSQAEIATQIKSFEPVELPIRIGQRQIQKVISELDPVALPVKFNRTQLHRAMQQLAQNPITLPVKFDRTQLHQAMQAHAEKPIALPVKFDRAQIQRALRQLEPPVTLPVNIDRDKIRRHLEKMQPVTVPVRYGVPTGRPVLGPINDVPSSTAPAGPMMPAGPSPAGPMTPAGPSPDQLRAEAEYRRLVDEVTQAKRDLAEASADVQAATKAEAAAQKNLRSTLNATHKEANKAFADREAMTRQVRAAQQLVRDSAAATVTARQRETAAGARLNAVEQQLAASKQQSAASTYGQVSAANALGVADARLSLQQEQSARRIADARARHAQAIRAVNLAEERLNTLRESGKASALQLTSAETSLANAKDREVRASEAVARAVVQEQRAHEALHRAITEGRRRLPGKAYLPIYAELVDNTGPQMAELRKKIRDLNNSLKIRPKYEAQVVYDEMGRAHVRYIKLHADTGTFAGEIMSKRLVSSLIKGMKFPGLVGPVASGLLAGLSAASMIAVPAFFAKLAFDVQSQQPRLKNALAGLQKYWTEALTFDSKPVEEGFLTAIGQIRVGAERLRPQLRAIFSDLPPLLYDATEGVIGFAQRAMPGLVTATANAGPVVKGFRDGLIMAGDGVTRFFDRIVVAAPEAGQTLRTFGVIASEVGDFLGRLGAAVTIGFGGRLWNEAEAVVGRLLSVVGDFASTALPGLGAGLEVAANALSIALAILEPFAGLMGTWVGTVLGAAVAVRGLSSAVGVLGAGMSLLKLTPLTTAVTTFATQVSNAGLSLGNTVNKFDSTGRAGERVAGVTSKVAGAFQKVGGSLPVVGAALIALGVVWDEIGSKADESAAKVVDGTISVADAVRIETEQLQKSHALTQSLIETIGAAVPVLGATAVAAAGVNEAMTSDASTSAEAINNVVEALREQGRSLTGVAKAQNDVKLAEAELLAARQANDPAAIEQATRNLADANTKLGAESRKAADAEFFKAQAQRDATDAMREQYQAMLEQMDANLNYRNSVDRVAESQKAAADAFREHGAASDEYGDAVRALEGDMLAQIDAAVRLASEMAAAHGPTAQQAAETRALQVEMMKLSSSTDGPTRQAFLNMAASMDTAKLSMYNATVEASGLKSELVTLPDGRQVRVVVDTDKAKLDELNTQVTQLENVTITLTANPDPAAQSITGTVNFGNGQVSTMTLDSNIDPATGKIMGTVDMGNGQIATITVDSNVDPATGKVNATVTYADGRIGTFTLDANQIPALQKTDGAVQHANSQRPEFPVQADTSWAERSINWIKDWASRGVSFIVNAISGNATGGYYKPMARGGYLPMAGGGGATPDEFMGRKLTPMSASSAQVVPPNTWRVIGDNMKVPELFVPLDGSKRSLGLMQQGAEAMDHVLVPKDELRGYGDGGSISTAMKALGMAIPAAAQWGDQAAVRSVAAAVQRLADAQSRVAVAAGAPQDGGVTITGPVSVTLQGTWDLARPNLPRELLVALEEALRDLGRSRK